MEDADKHIWNMIEIVLLYDSVSQNPKVKQVAKEKLAAKKEKREQIEETLMKSHVRRRDLLESGPVAQSQIERTAYRNSLPPKKS